jgi:monofunctional biosynthetic peptidoglycan transglycosylase
VRRASKRRRGPRPSSKSRAVRPLRPAPPEEPAPSPEPPAISRMAQLKAKLVWPSKRTKTSALRAAGALFILFVVIEYLRLPRGDEYKSKAPSSTPLMERRRDEALDDGRRFTLRYRWVPLSRISPSLVRAAVAAEDASFFSHRGFDYGEMGRALREAFTRFRARGASTITQQVAKNLYLSPSRTPVRKLKEAMITRRLESRLSKRRIMELYLNIIEWGDGIFGAEAAAEAYYRRSAASLTPFEAAGLAARIPNPRTYLNAALHPRRVAGRQRAILARMGSVRLPKQF